MFQDGGRQKLYVSSGISPSSSSRSSSAEQQEDKALQRFM